MLQLGLLSWPLRSTGWGVILASFVVGIYGSGVAALAAEYAAVRGYTAASGERTLDPAVEALSYTLVPVVEELVKIAPLLIAAISVKVRRQLGLSDYVVLGAGAGAGFGLLEVLLARATAAQQAEVFPGGGWMIPGGISLDLTYVPDVSEVLTTWLPASLGTVSIGALTPDLGASLHLVWGALAGLGAGLLLRGPGAGLRLAGLIPLGAAIGHHALFNYSGYAARRDGDPPGWTTDVLARLGDVLGWLPVAALAVAMALDYRQVRHGRRALPHTLLTDEHHGRTGTMALTSFAACCLPWTATIALRFARTRRALYYALRPEPDPLHPTVAEVAQRINETNRDDAWDAKRVRAHRKADPARRNTRRRRWWLYLIPLLLATPAILALGAGSYPQTTDLQNWFASGTGHTLLLSGLSRTRGQAGRLRARRVHAGGRNSTLVGDLAWFCRWLPRVRHRGVHARRPAGRRRPRAAVWTRNWSHPRHAAPLVGDLPWFGRGVTAGSDHLRVVPPGSGSRRPRENPAARAGYEGTSPPAPSPSPTKPAAGHP